MAMRFRSVATIGPALLCVAFFACHYDTAPSGTADEDATKKDAGRDGAAGDAAKVQLVDAAGMSAPRGLACVARLYGGQAVLTASAFGWGLKLANGQVLPWNDGITKAFEQRLNAPDLNDMFTLPYAAGPIVPVNTEGEDPGRFRPEALFKSFYGDSEAAVAANVVNVDFLGANLKFHKTAAPALDRVAKKLKVLTTQKPELAKFVTGPLGGTFVWRPIANSQRLSAHSYGIAIDIVVAQSNYWEWEKNKDSGVFAWKNRIPQEIVDAFESEKFVWGGRWVHYDTMHFEYRPEMFDAECVP
jgi:D-alanyl-D-alanine carboxypeptidase